MKHLIVAGLSALSIGALVSPTMASEVIAMKNNSPVIHQVAPVNLVQLGCQGYFNPHSAYILYYKRLQDNAFIIFI